MSELRVCELCGSGGATRGLVRYRDVDRWRFEPAWRCADHEACRTRCDTAGLDYWTVDRLDSRQARSA